MTPAVNVDFKSPVTISELGMRVKDPFSHLLLCHEKIKRSLVTVQNAADSFSSTAPALRAEAAAALDYELALLQLLGILHTQDEEQSLFPRLRKHVGDDQNSLKELMQTCEWQHGDERAIFEKLAICLHGYPSGQVEQGQLEPLETLVGQLVGLLQSHVMLENEHLIAAAQRYLTPAELDQIGAEMRRRFHI